jgi:hypothetical protein
MHVLLGAFSIDLEINLIEQVVKNTSIGVLLLYQNIPCTLFLDYRFSERVMKFHFTSGKKGSCNCSNTAGTSVQLTYLFFPNVEFTSHHLCNSNLQYFDYYMYFSGCEVNVCVI